MNWSFLFPGQGSQFVGMGAGWVDEHPKREWLTLASETVGQDLRTLCLEGPKEDLSQTVVTQPALYLLSAMLLHSLEQKGIRPIATAGHSAGEYAALLAAGAWDFVTGLRVISTRARIMYESGKRRPGGMAAVLGLDATEVKTFCRETFSERQVVVANLNTPNQTVISGEKECVERSVALLKEKGARRVLPLPVSGAFHSPLLDEGAKEFSEYLESVEIKDLSVSWVSNHTGQVERSAEVIRRHLAAQLIMPVRWTESMRTLDEMECDGFLEVGPGKVLTGLAKGCKTAKPCRPVGTPEEVDSILKEERAES